MIQGNYLRMEIKEAQANRQGKVNSTEKTRLLVFLISEAKVLFKILIVIQHRKYCAIESFLEFKGTISFHLTGNPLCNSRRRFFRNCSSRKIWVKILTT